MEKCFYCGKIIEGEETNSANDYGLHNIPDEVVCCSMCNTIVTVTNRYLSKALQYRGADRNKYLKFAIRNLENAQIEEALRS